MSRVPQTTGDAPSCQRPQGRTLPYSLTPCASLLQCLFASNNNYWRGRIWGPQVALVWLGLRRYDALPEARAARKVLVAQALRLELQDWRLFRQVAENYNGVMGAGEDVNSADPFYSWGALLGHVALLEAGF